MSDRVAADDVARHASDDRPIAPVACVTAAPTAFSGAVSTGPPRPRRRAGDDLGRTAGAARSSPGPLRLPPDKEGTLVVSDVATLALADQIALYDWLGAGAGRLRVISVTAAPLAALVARGAFLEGLFRASRRPAVQSHIAGVSA